MSGYIDEEEFYQSADPWDDGEENPLRRFAIERIEAVFRRGLRLVLQSPDPVAALWYFCLALGWYDEIDGCCTATDVAGRLGVSKQNATKYRQMFEAIIPPGTAQMPPAPGQRTAESRRRMSRRRREQIQNHEDNRPA